MKIKPIERCPHCGSDWGVYIKKDLINVPYKFKFDGSEDYNGEMYDNAEKIIDKENVYCQACDKVICRMSTLVAFHGEVVSDMTRYIDADKAMEEIDRIGGHNLCEWETIGVKALIDRQPTADVAPKSEVERLQAEVDRLKKDNEHILMQHRFQRRPGGDCWNDVIEKAKAEVAREIFEEIEKLKHTKFYWSDVVEWDGIAELKKEYTEGET